MTMMNPRRERDLARMRSGLVALRVRGEELAAAQEAWTRTRREAILAASMAGLSQTEIAELLGVSRQRVHAVLYRAADPEGARLPFGDMEDEGL